MLDTPVTHSTAAAAAATAIVATDRPRGQRMARIVLALALVGLGLYTLDNFLRALVWATILVIATYPLYCRAERTLPTDKHNILLPGLFTLVTTLVVVVPLILVGVQLGHEGRAWAGWVNDMREHGAPLPDALAHLPFGQEQVSGWWQENLADPEGAKALLGRMDRAELMGFGRTFGSRVLHSAVTFVFILLTMFFLYKDGPCLSQQMLTGSRRLFGPSGERVGRQVIASVHGTVDGLVLVGLGVGLVLGIGYVVAGVPHPAMLGTVTAVGAMFPLGGTIALLIASLLLVAAGKSVAGIVLFVFGSVVIFGADHFIRPALIGGATKLPFLWVLLGILGGVETFGLLGLFLGPAIMSALILLWREWTGDATPEAAG